MFWIDILIVAAVIIFILVGLYRGFFNSLLGLINTVASFILAVLFAKPFGLLLDKIFKLGELFTKVFTPGLEKISGFGQSFPQPSPIVDFISGLNPFLKPLVESATKNIETIPANITAGAYFASILAGFTLLIIGGILAFFILKFVLWLILKLFNKLKSKNKLIKKTDRILGGVFGLVQGLVIVFLVAYITSLLLYVPVFGESIQLMLNQTWLAPLCVKGSGLLGEAIIKSIDMGKILNGFGNLKLN